MNMQLAAGKCYFDTNKLPEAQAALQPVAADAAAKPEEQAEAAKSKASIGATDRGAS